MTIISLLLVSFLEVSPIYIIIVMIVLGVTFAKVKDNINRRES